MCGIAGIFDLKGERDVDRAALQRMANALVHRGPDGEGYFQEKGIGFAHRRLAIIDIEGGVQPFHASDGSVLCYNGEIYNFQNLARDLEAGGVRLKTRSDTEVLAEGLAREGAAFIHKLRGMFAFAFWNARERSLLLARDRLGERPLYYGETDDGLFVFASEIGALRASGPLPFDFSPQAVVDYFFYGYAPDPKTIYARAKKLPPAHSLTLKRGATAQPTRYWRPVFAPTKNLSFDDASSQLLEMLDDAVRAQMIADAPLGAFLSGGIDSGGVVAAMAEASDRIIACTVGFDEKSHDERAGARYVAQKFGADHYEDAASLDAHDLIDEAARAFGEPFADSSAIPSLIVAKLARQRVKVALTGDGGDEIFAGYRRYPFFLAEEKLRRLAPSSLRKAVFGPLGALYPKLDWAPRPLRAKTTLQALAASGAEAYANAVAINLPAQARAIVSGDLQTALNGYRPQSVVEEAFANAGAKDDPLAAAQHADLMTWLPGRMLVKVDRASMAYGLEARPPLLDYRLVEWAGLLPSGFKLTKGDRKRILKAALTPRLGAEYVNRPKQGFDMPVSNWFRRADSPFVARLSDSNRWRECGLIDAKAVEKMLAAHKAGARDCGQALWSVMMFDAFLQAA